MKNIVNLSHNFSTFLNVIKCVSTGNTKVLNWTRSTVGRYGICSDHFRDEDFTTGSKERIKRTAIPVPYDVGEQGKCQQEIIENSPNSAGNIEEDEQDQETPSSSRMTEERKTYPAKQLVFSNDDGNMEWQRIEPCEVRQRSPEKAVEDPSINSNREIEMLRKQLEVQNRTIANLRKKNKALRNTKLRSKMLSKRNNPRKKIKKLDKSAQVEQMIEKFNCKPAAAAMVKLQFHTPYTEYSQDEKELAKQLYYHSAAAYCKLRKAGCTFPGVSTIRKWISIYDIKPGFSDVIFEELERKLSQLAPKDRLCALKWDEMSIRAYEEFSCKENLIEGLVDMGPLGRSEERATCVFVFCVDCINAENSPWRQPVAYFLPKNTMAAEDIITLLKICLRKLKSAGADVKIVTCDQGPTNRQSYGPNGLNITEDNPSFEFEDEKYFASFDFPHLIKRLISHLRCKKRIYSGQKVIVDFDDYLQTWEYDKRGTSNLLNNITEIHMNPNSFQAMNVKIAFQILSKRFSAAIKLAGTSPQGLKSDTWEASAEFAEKMNDVIDACNAYTLFCGNPQKRPLAARNENIEKILISFLEWTSTWSMLPNAIKRPPCFSGLIVTVRALLECYKDIASQYSDFALATALCNQDSVEHLFSKLRQRGGHNPNPTARMVRLSLRHILSTGFIHSSDKGNVEIKEARSLLADHNTASTSFAKIDDNIPIFQDEDDEDELEVNEVLETFDFNPEIEEDKNVREEEADLYEKNAITYFAGYIAQKIIQKSKCDNCQEVMLKIPMDDETENELYIEFREYENKDVDAPKVSKLSRPKEIFLEIVGIQLKAFEKYWKMYWASNKIMDDLTMIGTRETNLSFPGWFDTDHECYQHRLEALRFLIKVKLFAQTRKNNFATRVKMTKSKKLKKIIHI